MTGNRSLRVIELLESFTSFNTTYEHNSKIFHELYRVLSQAVEKPMVGFRHVAAGQQSKLAATRC